VACVLAAVLGAGGWLMWLQPGPKTADSTPAVARQAPDEIRETVEKAPRNAEGKLLVDLVEDPDKVHYAPGTWATRKIFAKGFGSRVEAFKIGEGEDEAAWTLELSGPICATTDHVTADGHTAVLVQPTKRRGTGDEGICDELVFFDLDNGKVLWRKQLPGAEKAYVTNVNLTMARGTVALAWGLGSVAFDMKAGKQLWKTTGGSACTDQGFAGGRALLALLRCGDEADPVFKVQKVDPRTGRPQWTYRVDRGIKRVYLPSSEPPVLAVEAGDIWVTDLITLDDQGRRLAAISMEGKRYTPMCGTRYGGMVGFGTVEYCDGMVVGRTEVFVASEDTSEQGQPANWIMAFDMKTGRTVRKFDGRAMQPVFPLRMSGDRLLVFRQSANGIGPDAVVLWNPSTGNETPFLLFTLPIEVSYGLGRPDHADIVVEQGRAFFARREIIPDRKHPRDLVKAVIGIGAVK
jgi:outer membrane protein assembly factor BamB